MEATVKKVLTQEEAIELLRGAMQKALNRGTKHVSNIAINKVLVMYKAKNVKGISNIVKHLNGTKQAKSIDDLLYNILHDLKTGTRTDGQKVELEGFELF